MPYQLYINGRWTDAADGATIDVRNPATGELVAKAAFGGTADARAAMHAAAGAFGTWKTTSAHERAALLNRTAGIVRQRAQAIARVLTEENGKPLVEAAAEAVSCAAWLEWFAGEGVRAYGRHIPSHTAAKRLWVIRQPVGVVVAVTPWNFPVGLAVRKVGAALAAGCSVVWRPADQTPLSAMLLAECFHEAGFPPGAFNLVTGDGPTVVKEMMDHPACRKLAFTGSTAVGKKLMEQASRRLIRLSLELGGHAPLIVFPDVDLAAAVELTVAAKFRNAGQTCISPSRIYVHRRIEDAFRDAIVARAKRIVVGNGLEPGVEMGPMLNAAGIARVEAFLSDAMSRNARLLAGGKRLAGGAHDRGFFFAPTVIDRIPSGTRLTCEEYFGPILPLIPFENEAEVVAEANATNYGLAAYLLTKDLGTAIRVSEALEYGIVGVNDAVPTVPHAPFGGWKESGMGREGGSEGIDSYLETKYISVGI